MGIGIGLKQIVQIARRSVRVVQIQLDERVARIFRDILPEVQDVAAPPFRELHIGETDEPLVLFDGAPYLEVGQLLRRQGEAGHVEPRDACHQ